MNLFELSAKISMDTKDYEKAVKNAVSDSKSLKENFAKLAGQSETNANKIKVLASQYDSAKSKVAVLTTAFNKAANEEGVTAKKTQELAKELADAEKEADDLKNEMDSLSKKTKNTGDSVESLSDKLKKGLSNAAKVATGVLTTVASGFVALGKIGLEYNAQIESYTTDFEVMMGDAEAAARKVEELKEMGAKTPFELGDLASATKTLLAFNVSADDSTGVLQQLGDISLGNVQKLESLTLAYGKMNASQKVTLEDINMMIDAGFNPLLLVAENTGETMEEVYDRISKGGVAFEEISGAINQATSEGGQFYQGMDKASQTTQGLISTLKDAAQSKIGELFSSISEKIKELLPNVISFVENIDTDEIVKGVESLMQTFNDLLPVITGVTAATVAYKAATSIAGIIDALRKATEGQTIAQALLNAVMNANPFVLIVTLIAGLVTAIMTLWHTNDGFRDAISKIWDGIKNVFSGAWDFITGIFGAVGDFFSGVWDGIKNAFSSVGGWFKEKFQEGKENAEKAWENAKTIFGKVWDGVKGVFSSVGGWFKDRFTDGLENSKNAWATAKTVFSNVWTNIKGAFSNVGGWFKDKFTEAKNNSEKAWENAKQVFGKVWDKTKEAFADVGGWFKNKFEEGKNSAASAWSNTKSVFGGIWDKIKNIFSKGADIGKNIIDGIKQGISNAWNNLVDWFKGLFGDLIGIAKKILGIASPSKVFKKIGAFTAEGFGIGFDDEFAHVKDDMEDALNFDDASVGINASIRKASVGTDGIAYGGGNISIVQNIYSKAQTAADLMQEARYQSEQAVFLSV